MQSQHSENSTLPLTGSYFHLHPVHRNQKKQHKDKTEARSSFEAIISAIFWDMVTRVLDFLVSFLRYNRASETLEQMELVCPCVLRGKSLKMKE